MNSSASRFKYVKYAFVILGGVVLAALAMEAILRFTDPYEYDRFYNDEATGLLVHTPNTDYTELEPCFENEVTINNIGFHAQDVEIEKKDDVFRIVVIGSSFVEALQVPVEQLFSTRLQERLNASGDGRTYEVIPVGFSGNGTYLNILYYTRYAANLKPDLVIDLTTEFEVSKNDANADHPPLFDEEGNPVLSLSSVSKSSATVTAKNLLRRSKLIMNLYNRYLVTRAASHKFFAHPSLFGAASETSSEKPAATVVDESLWESEEKLVTAFKNVVARDQAKFLLVSWSTPLTDPATARAVSSHLTNVSTREKFPYLDLVPVLSSRETAEQKSVVWSCDAHWNETGHAWVGDAIFDTLRTHLELLEK